MIITDTFLVRHRTDKGGYTKAQLEALDLPYKVIRIKGWKNLVIGNEISEEKAQAFIEGKHIYSGKRNKLELKKERGRQLTIHLG